MSDITRFPGKRYRNEVVAISLDSGPAENEKVFKSLLSMKYYTYNVLRATAASMII